MLKHLHNDNHWPYAWPRLVSSNRKHDEQIQSTLLTATRSLTLTSTNLGKHCVCQLVCLGAQQLIVEVCFCRCGGRRWHNLTKHLQQHRSRIHPRGTRLNRLVAASGQPCAPLHSNDTQIARSAAKEHGKHRQMCTSTAALPQRTGSIRICVEYQKEQC